MFEKSNAIKYPSRIYEVGKFKEYRNLVGHQRVKSHNTEDTNKLKSQRKPVMNEYLDKIKFKKGHQINDAIGEIIDNLERFDETIKNSQRNKGSRIVSTIKSIEKNNLDSKKNSAATTFFPKLQKQKVLEKFIDLSTADVIKQSSQTAHPSQLKPSIQSNDLSFLDKINLKQMSNTLYHTKTKQSGYGFYSSEHKHRNNNPTFMSVHHSNNQINLNNNSVSKELSISLPQMGPNFNFYKFRDTQKVYKQKFNETSRQTFSVDNTLYHQWGESGVLEAIQQHRFLQEEDTYNHIMD